MKEEKGVYIFGKFFNNRKLFWNGVIFMLIGIFYDVLAIGCSISTDWKENIESLNSVNSGWIIQALFFIISYVLFDKRFFGDDPHEIIKKNGYYKYFSLKFLLGFILIFINLTIKVVALILFF